MSPVAELKEKITKAFAGVLFPGGRLSNSNFGDEPLLLEREFLGESDWRSLTPEFLDQAPDGYASALSFFSDKAFRFYIPAYMIAAIDQQLERVDPEFHLCHGLTNATKDKIINEPMYGNETWFEYAKKRFSLFDRLQADAIIAYLQFCKGDSNNRDIEQALNNYWRVRDRL